MENNELYHYGVLGMHWGVRRTPEQLGHRTKSSGSARSAKARVRVNKKKAGSTKPMTAEEKEARKKKQLTVTTQDRYTLIKIYLAMMNCDMLIQDC